MYVFGQNQYKLVQNNSFIFDHGIVHAHAISTRCYSIATMFHNFYLLHNSENILTIHILSKKKDLEVVFQFCQLARRILYILPDYLHRYAQTTKENNHDLQIPNSSV